LVGTIGDVGILSFVGQKNASCGEGGTMLTDNDNLARKARLLRNHAEALHEPMLGFNYRLQEIQAAIVSNQWDKLDKSNATRRALVASLMLKMGAEGIEGIWIPPVPRGNTHSFYVCPFLYDAVFTGVPRGMFVDAMNAEGIPMGAGYIQPLYMLPLFQRRAHFAFKHFGHDVTYHKGLCPTCEEMSFERLMLTMVCRPPATGEDMADVAKAMRKVLDQCPLY
jgi:dTDP-4-amino-4,6-dideoxygalactose transaminase